MNRGLDSNEVKESLSKMVEVLEDGGRRFEIAGTNFEMTGYWIGEQIRIDIKPKKGRGVIAVSLRNFYIPQYEPDGR